MTVTALTKSFPSSVRRINRDYRPLAAGVKSFAGGLCVANPGGLAPGYYGPATGASGEVVVGRFYGKYGEVDNTAGGNGALSAEVQFFRERSMYLLNNDTTAPLVAATREQVVASLNDNFATLSDGDANSPMGVFYDFSEDGSGQVWVEFFYPSPANPGGQASLQAGKLTLVAGTKALATGITITPNSKVFVSLDTPGGGTQGVKYKVPDASLVNGGPGTGEFIVTAVDNAGATVATDTSTINYLIVG